MADKTIPAFKILRGSVGVGTTLPSSTFHVYSDSSTNTIINLQGGSATNKGAYMNFFRGTTNVGALGTKASLIGGTSNDMMFYSASNDWIFYSTGERMRVQADGLVGIGTNAPAVELHINDASGLSAIRLTGGAASADGFQIMQGVTGVTNAGFSIYDVDATATRLVIDTNGKIGIGTGAPAVPLHVYTNSASGQEIMLENDGAGEVGIILRTDRNSAGNLLGWIGFDGNDGGNVNTRYATIESYIVDSLNGSEDGRLTFSVMAGGSDVESMTIAGKSGTSDIGWVGVGTNAPHFPLQVLGVSQTNGDAKRVVCILDSTSAAAGTGAGIALGGYTNGTASAINDFGVIQGIKENGTAGNYASAMLFSTRANGANPTERMRISSTGNVGIGEANPDKLLHIKGTNTAGIVIENTTNATNMDIDWYNNGGSVAGRIRYGEGPGDFYFMPNQSTNAVVFKYDGKVGIGTATPYRNTHIYVAANSDNFEGALQVGGTSAALGGYFGYNSTSSGRLTISSLNNAGGANAKVYLGFGLDGDGSPTKEVMTLTQEGKVIIGGNAPTKTFEVKYASTSTNVTEEGLNGGAAGTGLLIFNTQGSNSVYANLDFRANNADGRIAYQYQTATNVGDFHFITDNTGSPQSMMTIRNDGKVGIGTATPGSLLTVSGNSDDGDAACTIAINDEDSTGGSKIPAIQFYGGGTTQGRIRGGDTAFQIAVGSSPTTALNINTANGYPSFTYGSQVRLTLGSTGTAETNTANWVRASGANLEFNAASGDFNWEVGGVHKMRLTDTGNLGIGLGAGTDPFCTLHCNDGTIGGQIQLTKTSGGTSSTLGRITFGNTNIDSNLASIGAIQDGASDSAKLEFLTQATAGHTIVRMIIKSNGETHIGADAQGVAIHGNTSGYGSIVGVSRDGSSYKNLEINGATVEFKAAGTVKMTVASGGVGINATPDGGLKIKSTGDGVNVLNLVDSSGDALFNVRQSSNDCLIRGYKDGGTQTIQLHSDGESYLMTAAGGGTDLQIGGSAVTSHGTVVMANGTGASIAKIRVEGSDDSFYLSKTAGGGLFHFTSNNSFQFDQNVKLQTIDHVILDLSTPSGNNYTMLRFSPNGTQASYIRAQTNGDVIFDNSSGTLRMKMSNNGFIQIGNNLPVWSGSYGGALLLKGNNSTSDRYAQLTTVDSSGAVTNTGLIVKSGDVGIGTNAPARALDVDGRVLADTYGFRSDTSLRYYYFDNYSGSNFMGRGGNAFTSLYDGGTLSMVWKGGSVGIGTNNPTQQLVVAKSNSGGVGGSIRIDNSAGAAADKMQLIFSSFGNSYHRAMIQSTVESSSPFAGTLEFYTGISSGTFTEKMRVDHNGAVGIGTNSPSYKLHVTGGPIAAEDGAGTFRLIGTAISAKIIDLKCDIGVFKMRSVNDGREMYHVADSYHKWYISDSEKMQLNSAGNVGIGTDNPTEKLTVLGNASVSGSFSASSKSFLIDHPTKENKKLEHGCLEGPEFGVYHRGRVQSSTITLPDYWSGLVGEETITVQLTPNGSFQHLYVVSQSLTEIVIGAADGETIDCFYTIYGERADIDRLEVEKEV